MEDLFDNERRVVDEAEKLIHSERFDSSEDQRRYSELLQEYKRMLRQMKMMVKMSDIMQSKLNSMTGELEKLSQIDGLTGLYNRRYFNEVYLREWGKAVESQNPLGVLMIDIDHFKKYNDTYGHLEGDRCLQEVAASIKNTTIITDSFVARFGGEEFVVLLFNPDREDCKSMAEKIIENVDSLNIAAGIGALGSTVTVSIGVGFQIPQKNEKSEKLIDDADQALYRAKNEGRHGFRI